MSSSGPELRTALARELAAETNLTAVLQRVVDDAVIQVPGADHAGITFRTRSSVLTPVVTDDLVARMDGQRYADGKDPRLSGLADQQAVVLVSDLRFDARWPAFSAVAIGLGIRSMLSFQIYAERGALGTLNLYADEADVFRDRSVRAGRLLAAHAALAVNATAQNAHLRSALESRDTISRASKVLMARLDITSERAFGLMLAASRQTNRKLRDIARDLLQTGELPGSTGRHVG